MALYTNTSIVQSRSNRIYLIKGKQTTVTKLGTANHWHKLITTGSNRIRTDQTGTGSKPDQPSQCQIGSDSRQTTTDLCEMNA
jgi:hypothetical protein